MRDNSKGRFYRRAPSVLCLLSFLLLMAAVRAGAVVDALSGPDASTGLRLDRPRPPSDHPGDKFEQVQPAGSPEPVEKPGTAGPAPSPTGEAMPDTAGAGRAATPLPSATPKATPSPTPRPVEKIRPKSRGPAGPPPPEPGPELPWVTTIPNPARGDKVDFRIMTRGPAKALIVVYDNFLDKMAKLETQGDQLFDAIWSLKNVPEGLYYYQVQLTDGSTGKTRMLPIQNFAVLKK